MKTDADIRDVTGYSMETLGEIIGKTRQAVHRGLKNSENYFKPDEWKAIIQRLRQEQNQAAVAEIENYLKSSGEDFDSIDTLEGRATVTTVNIRKAAAGDIVALIPSVQLMWDQHRSSFDALLSLIVDRKFRADILVSTSSERLKFKSLVERAARNANVEPSELEYEIYLIVKQTDYPFIFNVASDPSGLDRKYLTLLNDVFVLPDQRLFGDMLSKAIDNILEDSDQNPENSKLGMVI